MPTIRFLVLIVVVNACCVNLPAAETADARMMPGVTGNPAIQNVLRRVLSRWQRDFSATPRSVRVRASSLASHRQPTKFKPLVLTSDNWIGPAASNWNNSANWSAGVPNNAGGNTFNVFIDNGRLGTSAVTLDISPTINNLTIDADDSLAISNGNSLTIAGTSILNAGNISLNSTGSSTGLVISSNVTLNGGGTLTLSNSSQNVISGLGGLTLTNFGDTISGSGNIGNNTIRLVNSGTINANQVTALNIETVTGPFPTPGTRNTGTLEATNGGTLNLFGVTANSGGTIQAVGAGSIVNLENNATISSGILSTSGGGVIQGAGTVILDAGVKNSGTYSILDGTKTTMVNPNNTGVIQVNSVGNVTILNISNGGGGSTLTGGGTVTLSNNAANEITGFVSNINNTISGSGTIEALFLNSGVIDANQSTPLTIITSADSYHNSGTLEATNGATLKLVDNSGNPVISNGGGTIEAVGAGSNVSLSDFATIDGGMLTTSGGGVIQTSGTTTLNGVTNKGVIQSSGRMTLLGGLNSGTYTVEDASMITLGNGAVTGSFDNTNTIQLNSAGNATSLEINGNVRLFGKGQVILSNNAANSILGVSGTNVLVNANNTISGSGNIGDNQMGLNNQWVIDANQSTPLTIQTSNGTINTGTLEATNGATLNLLGDTYANAGGTIQAVGAGSIVNLEGNVRINGGTLTTTDGGVIQSAGATILNGVTNAGTLSILNNTGTLLAGTITNNGAIQVNSSGNATGIQLSGNVALAGTGTLTLSNNTQNLILGITGTEVLTNSSTIQGSGNIGGNSMGLVNNGDILANQSTPLLIDVNTQGFTNNGTLNVSASDTLQITGAANSFLNFNSGTGTLTGGNYVVAGTLQFDNANITTNAANITLTGVAAKIVNQVGTNALLGFNTNAATGSFTLAGGQALTTTGGSFSNAGTVAVGSGSSLTIGGSGFNYTQTAGSTTVDGTLTSTSAGTLSLNGGSLFGGGTIGDAVVDSGTITPGDSATKTGDLSITKTYTQNTGGALDISIGGTTAGSQYDQVKVTGAASLNGTLNVSLVNGFTPAVGSQFIIVNAGSLGGTFSTVNGLSINGSEHFALSYNGTEAILTVVAGAAGSPTVQSGSSLRSSHLTSTLMHSDLLTARRASGSLWPVIGTPYTFNAGRHQGPVLENGSRPVVNTPTRPSGTVELASPSRLHNLRPADLTTSAFFSPNVANAAMVQPVLSASLPGSVNPFPNSAAMDHHRFECGVDLRALLKTGPKRLLKGLVAEPDSGDAVTIGYLSLTPSH
jgi:hypothetical protein